MFSLLERVKDAVDETTPAADNVSRLKDGDLRTGHSSAVRNEAQGHLQDSGCFV